MWLDGPTSSDGPSGWEEDRYAALLLLHVAGCVIPGASRKNKMCYLIPTISPTIMEMKINPTYKKFILEKKHLPLNHDCWLERAIHVS